MAVNSFNDAALWHHLKDHVIKNHFTLHVPIEKGLSTSVVTLVHAQRVVDAMAVLKFQDLLAHPQDKFILTVDGETSYLSSMAYKVIKYMMDQHTDEGSSSSKKVEAEKIELIPLGKSMNIRRSTNKKQQ